MFMYLSTLGREVNFLKNIKYIRMYYKIAMYLVCFMYFVGTIVFKLQKYFKVELITYSFHPLDFLNS